jgi:ATP-dependent phosphofructokinase / diphosphate-dependent phosphofructokinase
MKRLAINTGGGDAPGLNAVIRAVVLSCRSRGWEVYGIRRGYEGLFVEGGIVHLTGESVRGITHIGGTILGTTNRGSPLASPVTLPDGTVTTVDRSDDVVEAFKAARFDGLIAIGGDGSLHIASKLFEKGLPVIGVPKTIDNDLSATAVTFGFGTAVQTATDALDKLHSTAEAHQRVMVVELMGRHTGWIALYAGIAGTADVILIPEIPYDLESVCAKIEDRYRRGREFAIVVAAEGAFEKGGEPAFVERATPGAAARYGGVAEKLAHQIADTTGRETRSLVLGHLQRGGAPNAEDRLLAFRYGAAAVELAAEGQWGCMVGLDPPHMKGVPLKEAVRSLKTVPPNSDLLRAARAFGVSFGD